MTTEQQRRINRLPTREEYEEDEERWAELVRRSLRPRTT